MTAASTAELTLLLHPECGFAATSSALAQLGWQRDPDRTNVDTGIAGEPSFASWSRGYGDDGEVDYAFDPETGRRLLRLRGEAAAERRAEIAASLEVLATGEDLARLADALGPLFAALGGDRAALAHIGDSETRWEMLRGIWRLGREIPPELLRTVLSSFLTDPDWRLRMTAMLAVGRFHLLDLAGAVFKTVVPEAQPGSLTSEDRRILLAARATVGDMLAESPPGTAALGSEPDVVAARTVFLRRLAAIIRGEKVEGVDRALLLVTALTAPEVLPSPGSFPDQWYAWLPPSVPRP
jgi:hypothetical protein